MRPEIPYPLPRNHKSGLYTSYWNAFLVVKSICLNAILCYSCSWSMESVSKTGNKIVNFILKLSATLQTNRDVTNSECKHNVSPQFQCCCCWKRIYTICALIISYCKLFLICQTTNLCVSSRNAY